MPEQVLSNVYRIEVPMPNNPLKYLNSYLIRGKGRDLLIDTGFRRDVCREALFSGLEELNVDRRRMDVLLTHLHSDHSGLAADAASEESKIYISRADFDELSGSLGNNSIVRKYRHERFVLEGFPEEKLTSVEDSNPAAACALRGIDERFCCLSEGDVLEAGDFRLEAVLVPGHTPGNMMFWAEKQGVMFTGDHILFDVSPNITARPTMEDALGSYLDSLKKAKRYPVKTALPAHRKSGDYQARITALLNHHERRLSEVIGALKERPGMNAYEIAGCMTWQIRVESWEKFPPVQQWYAVGECLAHIDYLLKRGAIVRREEGKIRKYENR